MIQKSVLLYNNSSMKTKTGDTRTLYFFTHTHIYTYTHLYYPVFFFFFLNSHCTQACSRMSKQLSGGLQACPGIKQKHSNSFRKFGQECLQL